MQFMNDPFGQQQFGQGGFGGGPMSMGGPSGFAGDMPQLGAQPGDGMFGADPKKKRQNGINPLLMMLSPLMGLMQHHPNAAMFGLSPLAGMMGAFK